MEGYLIAAFFLLLLGGGWWFGDWWERRETQRRIAARVRPRKVFICQQCGAKRFTEETA